MNTHPTLARSMLAASLSLAALAQAPDYGPLEAVTEGTNGATRFRALDVDADGDLDILTINPHANVVMWLEATSPGRFAAPRILVALPGADVIPAGPLDVALLDLSATGAGGDLVVAQDLGNRIVRLPRTGPTGFGAPVTVAQLDRSATSLATFDFDGDGDTDLVTSGDLGGPGTWLFENVTGTLSSPVRLGDGGDRVEPTDFDGDGDIDLVVSSPTGAATSLRNDGVPGSLAATTFAFSTAGFDLAVADVDGDGFDDVVVTGSPSFSVRIFLGDGAGGFTVDTTRSYGLHHPGAPRIAALDLDGDSDVDIAVAPLNARRVDWLENLGSGTFAQIETGRFASADSTRRFAVADLDADGGDDLMSVGRAGSAEIALSATFATQSALVELTRVIERPVDALVIDADTDGDLDLAVVARYEGAAIALNDGAGGLSFPTPIQGLEPNVAPWLAAGHAADLDGDGRVDLLLETAAGQILWSRQTASGFAPPAGVGSSGEGLVRTADVDADGLLDVVATVAVPRSIVAFVQGPVGTFGPGAAIAATFGRPKALELRDMDADGVPDIVTFEDAEPGTGPDRFLVYYGIAGGGYELGALLPTTPALSSLGTAIFEDLDGDGRTDVVFRSGVGLNRAITWIRNLGGRQYAAPADLGPVGESVKGLALRPAAAGGAAHLLVATMTPATAERYRLFEITAANTLGASTQLPSFGSNASALVFAGLGTGGHDLVIADEGVHRVAVSRDGEWRAVGTAYCGPANPNSVGRSGRIRAFGSADPLVNRLDLVATELPPGVTTLFLASLDAGLTPNPGGSQGDLCLGGAIGRLNQAGVFGPASAAGLFRSSLDLTAIPQPTGFVTVQPQSVWRFQAWHRDTAMGTGATSNFSDAVEVRFD